MEVKVYHVRVLRKVKTEILDGLEPKVSTATDVIKFVGDSEMEAFIGFDEKRNASGELVRIPKKQYFKQLGYLGAHCIKVANRKGESLSSEDEDIARINGLLNPPEVKTEAQTLAEKFENLAAENAQMKAELEAMKSNKSKESKPSVTESEAAPPAPEISIDKKAESPKRGRRKKK